MKARMVSTQSGPFDCGVSTKPNKSYDPFREGDVTRAEELIRHTTITCFNLQGWSESV